MSAKGSTQVHARRPTKQATGAARIPRGLQSGAPETCVGRTGSLRMIFRNTAPHGGQPLVQVLDIRRGPSSASLKPGLLRSLLV